MIHRFRVTPTPAWVALVGVLAGALELVAFGQNVAPPPEPPPLAVRITSPLGRIGMTLPIRIVARINAPDAQSVYTVRFFVNGVLVGEDDTGPAYAVEWTDTSPFERCEIVAEVSDAAGATARDSVTLDPLEVVDNTEVFSVLVEATVIDEKGRRVSGMGKSGFILSEDGVRQTLDIVKPESTPAVYALLIDSSHSMARRMDFVRDAALQLARVLRPKDRILVVPFSLSLRPLTGPTDDLLTVTEAISSIQAGGGTAIVDSLAQMTKVLSAHDGRRAIILLTDGYDEDSTRATEEAVEAVKASDTTVYTVGIGGVAGISLRGERVLRAIARETGGEAFFPYGAADVSAANQSIASDVHTRYLITYTPINQKADGRLREIDLRTADSSYTVRARTGYRAPIPPPIRPSLEFTILGTERQLYELSAEDLIVVENGVEQKVDTFQEAVTPVSIVLALDESGSMRPVAGGAQDAARSFVRAVRPEDKLAMIVFADQSMFVHDLATERSWSFDAIDDYRPTGGTALFDAVTDALLRLKTVTGRKAVVVMTDGRDENAPGTAPGSYRTMADALAQLRLVDATIYAVGLGPKVDRAVLERFARDSGGEAFFPEDVSALQEDYARIVEALRRRFVISYTSTDSTRDGAWRDVDIRCRIPTVTVTSRGGYFAPDR